MSTRTELGPVYDSRGFVVVRRLLSPDHISEIVAAYDRVMQDTPVSDFFGGRGSRCLKEYLGREPALDALIDHTAILDVTVSIDGLPALYTGAGSIWYMLDDVPWHCDGQPGRVDMPIKMSIYLDELTEREGAFRLLPGTHIPSRSLGIMTKMGVWEHGRPRIRPDVPRPLEGEVIVETEPGDVVFWDNRVWHAAPRRTDGTGRRAIFVNYMRDPREDASAIQRLREDVADTLSRRRQRCIYPKRMACERNPQRQRTIRRLEELGVIDVTEASSPASPDG